MGGMTGEINEAQNPRNPFVQGISCPSMGEMRDFRAKSFNFSKQTNNLHIYALLVWTEQKGSLPGLNYQFATDKPLLWYRQTQQMKNDGYSCKSRNRYTVLAKAHPAPPSRLPQFKNNIFLRNPLEIQKNIVSLHRQK